MIKNPYQKDYQNELKQNRHGLLVTRTSYQGDFYVLPFDEQQKRRTGILNVIWTIALWVIELGMGLINRLDTCFMVRSAISEHRSGCTEHIMRRGCFA